MDRDRYEVLQIEIYYMTILQDEKSFSIIQVDVALPESVKHVRTLSAWLPNANREALTSKQLDMTCTPDGQGRPLCSSPRELTLRQPHSRTLRS